MGNKEIEIVLMPVIKNKYITDKETDLHYYDCYFIDNLKSELYKLYLEINSIQSQFEYAFNTGGKKNE